MCIWFVFFACSFFLFVFHSRILQTHLKEIIENNSFKSESSVLQRNLETVLRKAAELADSVSTREYRQRSILTKSSCLKSELQDLLAALRDGETRHQELMREESARKRTKKMASTSRRHLKALQKEVSVYYLMCMCLFGHACVCVFVCVCVCVFMRASYLHALTHTTLSYL